MTLPPPLRRFLPWLLAVSLAAGAAPAVSGPRVRLQTSAGAIVIELALRQAPITATNFLAYVDHKRFDGTVFYRAARTKGDARHGFIQGGIQHRFTLMLNPIAHEPTTKTHLQHLDGTISMARNAPGTAMGDFFITVGAMPSMDASRDDPGFAAFGHVTAGMDVVRRILAAKTFPGGSAAMKGQLIAAPVTILTARRVP